MPTSARWVHRPKRRTSVRTHGEGMSNLPILAGMASTLIFAASTLPMLVKAYRTRDLSSYSLGNISLANVGNAVHSVYVFSLPAGPLWVLHSFYLASTALMLTWFLRYRVPAAVRSGRVRGLTHPAAGPDASIARSARTRAIPSVAA
jgi:hypothetical protein